MPERIRIGELCGVQWKDIDFDKKVLYVRHTLCYFQKGGKYIFEMHDAKTKNGRRTIPLTTRALEVLKRQRIQKQKILGHGSLQMTMELYCHVTEDTLFTEMMKMEKAV